MSQSHNPSRIPVWIATVVAAMALALAASSGQSARRGAATPGGSPCPVLIATPGAATPVPACDPIPLGTPVALDDLTASLLATEDRAGPNTLTVVLADETGAPVTDAVVTIRTRSLAMHHGVSTKDAPMAYPGHYVARRVALGMGGEWLAEVQVEMPDAPVRVFRFVITLTGPTH